MQFNGFNVYPVGQATLSVVAGKLQVSGISNSGLDGVLIDTQGHATYTVNFGDLSSIAQNNGVFKTSMLVRNSLGQVVPFAESFKWHDQQNNKVILGYNSNFLPQSYNVFGKLSGQTVFDLNNSNIGISPDPNFEPPSWAAIVAGLVLAGIGIGVAIWSALRTKVTRTVTRHIDLNGNVTGYSYSVAEDPVPFVVEVNGNSYTVDEVGLYYTTTLPSQLIGKSAVTFEAVGEQITGCNLSSFEITSIV